MLTLAMQYGIRPGPDSLLEPLALIVGGACIGGLVLLVTRSIVGRVRRARSTRRAERLALHRAACAETRARALMSELCPHGWHAEITLFGSPSIAVSHVGGADGPSTPGAARVALDWTELSAGTGRPAVMRRVWADSVGEALEAMVADRRTDETLEQIEQGADGALWPDL